MRDLASCVPCHEQLLIAPALGTLNGIPVCAMHFREAAHHAGIVALEEGAKARARADRSSRNAVKADLVG